MVSVGVSGTAMEKSVYDPDLDGVIAKAQIDTSIHGDMEAVIFDSDGDNAIGLDAMEVVAAVSDDLRKSEDDVRAGQGLVGASYGVCADVVPITIPARYHAGNYRIKFSMKTDGGGTTTFRIYKNGVSAGGTEHTEGAGNWTEKTDDFVGSLVAGDVLNIWGKGVVGSIKEFRIYCTDTFVSEDKTW